VASHAVNRRSSGRFLSETQRMNVALTRARRKLLVIGDSATLAGHELPRHLLDYIERIGAYHSVWEELPVLTPRREVAKRRQPNP
jgi:ATP-dependent RNA/DNA helicase IGHMBP2